MHTAELVYMQHTWVRSHAPCIDEGHAMTQERDLYIQLDMANGEGAVVFLFALEGQCLIILTIYVKAFFFKNKT